MQGTPGRVGLVIRPEPGGICQGPWEPQPEGTVTAGCPGFIVILEQCGPNHARSFDMTWGSNFNDGTAPTARGTSLYGQPARTTTLDRTQQSRSWIPVSHGQRRSKPRSTLKKLSRT